MDEAKNTYIFVSGLSAHTHDLYHLPKASILFAEEDSQTAHIFARRRLVFECNAVLILRDTQEWFQITGDFEQRRQPIEQFSHKGLMSHHVRGEDVRLEDRGVADPGEGGDLVAELVALLVLAHPDHSLAELVHEGGEVRGQLGRGLGQHLVQHPEHVTCHV